MTRWLVLAASVWVVGCSDLTEGAGGVVQLEITRPIPDTVEVNEVLQLSARALDKDGNVVSQPVTWSAVDPTLTIDGTGLAAGVAPGTGRVQASIGSLSSPLLSLTVIARADTLSLVGDSIVTVAPGVSASTPLVALLQTFSPPGPVASRGVVYQITAPPDVGPHSVELPGGVLIDTIPTGADGTVQTAILSRVAGVASPESAIVEVRAHRLHGALVRGSGQRFIVRFQ